MKFDGESLVKSGNQAWADVFVIQRRRFWCMH